MSNGERITLAICLELSYVLVRGLLQHFYTGPQYEILVTAARAASALLYWLLFAPLRTGGAAPTSAHSRVLVPAVALLLCSPVIAGNVGVTEVDYWRLLVGTSVVVAIREELFYRVGMQSILATKFAPPVAVLLSALLFVLCHYGAQPFTPFSMVSLFATGVVLGTVYFVTRSIVIVVMIHFVDDVLWISSPFFGGPHPQMFASAAEIVALCLGVGVIAKNTERHR